MLTALDASPDALDEQELSFVANIREHGWFRTGVFDDEGGPGFSYTTGFWVNAGHAELIVFNLKGETAHDIFWDLFRDAQGGLSLSVGKRTGAAFGNFPAYAFAVAPRHYADHLGWNSWFYGAADFPCLQLVWPDPAGLFPWEPGFDAEFAASQPDLTERGWANEIID